MCCSSLRTATTTLTKLMRVDVPQVAEFWPPHDMICLECEAVAAAMQDSVLILEMDEWSPELLPPEGERPRIFAFDPATSSLLDAHSVRHWQLENVEPRRSWREIHAALAGALRQDAEPPDEALLDVFSHYLIHETSLAFERLCRIETLVREGAGALTFAVARRGSPADEVCSAAEDLFPGLPVRRALR